MFREYFHHRELTNDCINRTDDLTRQGAARRCRDPVLVGLSSPLLLLGQWDCQIHLLKKNKLKLKLHFLFILILYEVFGQFFLLVYMWRTKFLIRGMGMGNQLELNSGSK